MATIDYTPVLLAQLTDLQTRVTTQEAIINTLKQELERIAGRTISVPGATMKSSVPLLPTMSVRPHDGPRAPRTSSRDETGRVSRVPGKEGARSRPKVATNNSDSEPRKSMSLSDVLKTNEEVTIQVGTGKDAEGNFTHTTAIATFDGTDLTVNKCELVESLVNMKSSKPGEILYKFIDELKTAGHIKRTFTIAPWKLCSVVRNGERKTLEQLRN